VAEYTWYDIVPAHFSTAVTRLDEERYLVVWVEGNVGTSDDTPAVGGPVRAQTVVCGSFRPPAGL
jgi:hypothetical protein